MTDGPGPRGLDAAVSEVFDDHPGSVEAARHGDEEARDLLVSRVLAARPAAGFEEVAAAVDRRLDVRRGMDLDDYMLSLKFDMPVLPTHSRRKGER